MTWAKLDPWFADSQFTKTINLLETPKKSFYQAAVKNE